MAAAPAPDEHSKDPFSTVTAVFNTEKIAPFTPPVSLRTDSISHVLKHKLDFERFRDNHAVNLPRPALLRPRATCLADLVAADTNSTKDVSICVRIRPLLQNELEKGLFSAVIGVNPDVHAHSIESRWNVFGNERVGTFKSHKFGVDTVFSETNSSEEVYVETAQRLIPIALGSGVGTLFAYGQT
ncbi:hypothetical protein BDK51DRAFT_29168, partial [Blyttiomyces helicus]